MTFSFSKDVVSVTSILEGCFNVFLVIEAGYHQRYSRKIIKVWCVIYAVSSISQVPLSWVLLKNIMEDVDTLLHSPIARHSEWKKSAEAKLKYRKKNLSMHKLYHCGYLLLLWCIVSVALVFDGILVILNYLMPLNQMILCFRICLHVKHCIKTKDKE